MRCDHTTAPAPTPAPGNVVALFDGWAAARPDAVALVECGRRADRSATRLTVGELAADIDRLAAGLRDHGLRAGDRVVVMVPVSVDLYAVVLALLRLAAVPVLIEPSMGPRAMARGCRAAEPVAFVGTPATLALRTLPAFREIRRSFSTGSVAWRGAIPLGALPAPRVPVTTVVPPPASPAVITFTTGTGGHPKAMARTHEFLWRQHLAIAEAGRFEPGDVDFTTFPMFVLDNMASRVPTVLTARVVKGRDEAALLDAFERNGVTVVKTSPDLLDALATTCERTGRRLPGVRAVLTGGAPVHPDLVGRLRRVLPDGEVYVFYGSTEVEPIAFVTGQEIVRETGERWRAGAGSCVGRPLASLSVRPIVVTTRFLGPWGVDIDAITAPAGEPGELAVAGPHVNETYFRDPEAEARSKFRDRGGRLWHRTGDVGYLDPDGRIWLVGTVRARVSRDGRALDPATVEPAIGALRFVRRAALVGVRSRCVRCGGEDAVVAVELRHRSQLLSPRARRQAAAAVRAAAESCAFPVDAVRFARRIPLDRHGRGKIRYARLRSRRHHPWLTRPAR